MAAQYESPKPLSREWAAYLVARAESRRLRAESCKLHAASRKLWAEIGNPQGKVHRVGAITWTCAMTASEVWAEANRLIAESREMHTRANQCNTESRRIQNEAVKLWAEAVKAEFGPACTITWTAEGCTLSVGETYLFKE